MTRRITPKEHKLVEAWKDPVKRAKWCKAIKEGQEEYKKWKRERNASDAQRPGGGL